MARAARFNPWRLVRKDVGRKVTALAFALMTWGGLQLFIIDKQPFDLDVRVVSSLRDADLQRATAPAIYLVVPNDLLVRATSHSKVLLSAEGQRQDVVDAMRMSAVLIFSLDDLEDEDERNVTRPLIRESFVALDEQPQLTEFKVNPDVLGITLARRDGAIVTLSALNVQTVGKPREGQFFRNESVRVRPSQVWLEGPRAVIEEIREDAAIVQLEPVNVEGKSRQVSQWVGLDPSLKERGVRITDAPNGRVEVTVPMTEQPVSKKLFGVKVFYEHAEDLLARGLRVVSATETLDLEISGPQSALSLLTEEQLRRRIKPMLDWAAMTLPFSRETVPIFRIDLPDTLSIVDLNTGEAPLVEYELADILPDEPVQPAANGDDGP